MSKIHPTAIISKDAIIGNNVKIGAYSIIENAIIEDDVIIHSHVVINEGVTLNKHIEVFPGALIGKEPKGAGALARQPEYKKQIFIGRECSIGPHSVIFYDVEIGNNTLIGDGASIRENCRIGFYCVIGRNSCINYNVTIGNRTKIIDNSNITGNCIIGNDVFISTMVGMANDNIIREGYGEHLRGPIIEDFAFIGLGASLLPSIKVGTHSIIAAGAVVTKDVEPYSVVAGIPARFIRKKE